MEDSGVEIKIVTNAGKTEKKKYEKWELEEWASTLCRASEIKADPAKMAALKPLLDKKLDALDDIDDLRKLAAKKISRVEQYQPDGKGMEGEEFEEETNEKEGDTIEA